ncbi:MAG: hypothetical protein CSA21_08275, partial [Deltaproteobacteria bacterium]
MISGQLYTSRQQRQLARLLLAGLLFTVATLAVAGSADGADDTEGDADSPEVQIKNYRQGILDLESTIAVARGEDNQFKREEEEILYEIRQIDSELGEHQTKLRALRNNLACHRRAVARLEKESVRLKKLRSNEEKMLQQRVSAFYKMGRIGLLNATFSNRSLPDLITFSNAFEELVQYDKKLIAAYEQTLELQEKSRASLEEMSVKIDGFIRKAATEEKEVEQARKEMSAVLKGVQGKRKLRRKTIRRLRRDSARLSEALAKVKDELLRREKAFLDNKGRLPMPAEGRVVTRFHQWQENRFGEKERCEGIEIEVADGTPVHAVGGGKVIFADYFEGLGNTVIINHGSQFYSVTARLESISVAVARSIKAGTVIGIAGDAATLFTNGIYFEIRNGERQ